MKNNPPLPLDELDLIARLRLAALSEHTLYGGTAGSLLDEAATALQSKDAEILALRGRIEAALAVINYAAERLWNGRPDAIRDRPRSRRDASMTRQTNPSLSEAVERLTHLVEMEPDDALLAGHVCDVDISDLRIILQSLSVDEEVIARARDAIADLLQALDAADSVKRGDFYHERKEARAVLDTLGMAK